MHFLTWSVRSTIKLTHYHDFSDALILRRNAVFSHLADTIARRAGEQSRSQRGSWPLGSQESWRLQHGVPSDGRASKRQAFVSSDWARARPIWRCAGGQVARL